MPKHAKTFLVAALAAAGAAAACQSPRPPRDDEARSAPQAQAPAAQTAETKPADPPEPPKPEPEVAPNTPGEPSEALLNPSVVRQAPERYSVQLNTTQGVLTIDVRRSWAPIGADRFYSLVRLGYYDDVAFFRVLDGYVAQTGLHGHPKVNAAWARAYVPDDPREQSNVAGTVAFAASGPNTRTTQFFVNLASNTQLDKLGFQPFGRVKELDVARKLYSGYGEGSPAGQGPAQARVKNEGNAYLRRFYPKLDYVQRATIVSEANPPAKQRTLPPPKAP